MVVKNKKAQLKIQQMAFMLIAITLFFVLVGMFVLKIQLSELRNTASILEEKNALLLVTKLANSPEFSCGEAFGNIRTNCIDAAKVMMLREKISSPASFAAPLFDKLEGRWFEAIVLEKWAASFPGLHFGKGFYESVEENYCLAKETKHWFFYFRCDEKENISDSMKISQNKWQGSP